MAPSARGGGPKPSTAPEKAAKKKSKKAAERRAKTSVKMSKKPKSDEHAKTPVPSKRAQRPKTAAASSPNYNKDRKGFSSRCQSWTKPSSPP
jgi:hypothetical protein